MSRAFSLSILLLAILVVVLPAESYAQVPPSPTEGERIPKGSIRGRVIMPDGSYVDEAVKITLSTLRGVMTTVYAESQGQFEFEGVAAGTYYLEFEADRNRFQPVSETVQVYRDMPTNVTVSLRLIKRVEGSKPGTVSVAELEQKIPDRARKEFEKASSAGGQGRIDEAIAHLQKAISIFPSFVRAHNDLGTYFLAQAKLDNAEESFRRAIALDAKSFNPILNLGIVLVHKHEFAAAADQLTKALSIEPNSPAAHLYAGLAFMGRNNLEAAEKDLKAAYSLGGQKFGVALYHLGQLYMDRGDQASALKSFTAYLSVVPDARNAEQVQKLIAMLRP